MILIDKVKREAKVRIRSLFAGVKRKRKKLNNLLSENIIGAMNNESSRRYLSKGKIRKSLIEKKLLVRRLKGKTFLSSSQFFSNLHQSSFASRSMPPSFDKEEMRNYSEFAEANLLISSTVSFYLLQYLAGGFSWRKQINRTWMECCMISWNSTYSFMRTTRFCCRMREQNFDTSKLPTFDEWIKRHDINFQMDPFSKF